LERSKLRENVLVSKAGTGFFRKVETKHVKTTSKRSRLLFSKMRIQKQQPTPRKSVFSSRPGDEVGFMGGDHTQ
jgi:hypothetical protein